MAEAAIINGKQVAERVKEGVKSDVEGFEEKFGYTPRLATVLVGDDPGSAIYVKGKKEACQKAGIRSFGQELPDSTGQEEIIELVKGLGDDPDVHGILVQLPLPRHINSSAVIESIRPMKDVDGLTPYNVGLLVQGRDCLAPCTPAGVIELLKQAKVEIEGAEAVVLGRSMLVGKPLASLLLAENATVTICHSRTADLESVCSRADILVAATGRPRLVGPDMVKRGATVIDVGINRTDDGLVGDVDFDRVKEVAGAITPVPGGVGPMTIAMLLRNTLKAARLLEELVR